MASTTIAFSTSNNVWTTRYSFTPTCYATLNDEMISCPETNTKNIGWRHDTSEVRNNFYGVDYQTEFTIVANTNPSMSKTFHAMSVEGNYNKWGVDFFTGGVRSEEQQTYLSSGDLERRGGTSYSHVPMSQIKTAANMQGLGFLSGFSTGIFGSGTAGTAVFSVSRLSDAGISITPETRLGVITDAGDYFEPQLYLDRIDYSNNAVYCSYPTSITPSSMIATLQPYEGAYFYFSNPGRIDGDPMKGHYMAMTLSTELGDSSPIELFAVNTEFVDDPLNSTLG